MLFKDLCVSIDSLFLLYFFLKIARSFLYLLNLLVCFAVEVPIGGLVSEVEGEEAGLGLRLRFSQLGVLNGALRSLQVVELERQIDSNFIIFELGPFE